MFHGEHFLFVKAPGVDMCYSMRRRACSGEDSRMRPRAIRHRCLRVVYSKMTRVMAIVNQKGGVGKTTTTVNLSAALAELGQRVLVIDLDPQGNTTSGFGVDKAALEHDVYDLLLGDIPIAELLVDTGAHDVALVPATINLAGVEVELVSAKERELRLKKALTPLIGQYEYILIDCPPSLGLLTVNALTAATEVLIPVQAEYYALEGLSQLTNVVARVRDTLNPYLRITGLLVTMFDGRTKLAGEVLDEVNQHFPTQVFKTQIPRNVRLSEAPSFGKPAVLYDVRSRGAQAYVALAREVVEAAESIGANAPGPAVLRGSEASSDVEAGV